MIRLPFFLAVLLWLASACAFGQTRNAWQRMHADPLNTGQGLADGSDGFGQWSYLASGSIDSSPAIDSNWNIYFGTADGYLVSLDEHGNLRWKFKANGQVYSPMLGANSTVFVGSEDGNLYAINTGNGTAYWQYQTHGGVRTTPVLDGNGVVFGSQDENIYCVDPISGTLIARATATSTISLSPASDGFLDYFVTDDGHLYSFGSGGSGLHVIATNQSGFSTSPVLAPDGSILVGSNDSNIYDYSNGAVAWSFTAGSPITSTPAVGPDGTIYFGTQNGSLYSHNQAQPNNPLLNWVCAQSSGPIYSSPAIGDAGVIYFGSDDGHLYATQYPGNVTWQVGITGSKVRSSPAITFDGTVMVGAENSTFYAIGTQSPIPVQSITVTPSSVIGGAGMVGTVTLTQSAPSGGDTVNLRVQNEPENGVVPPPCSSVPPVIQVQQFHTSAQFTITTITPSPVSPYFSVTVDIFAVSGFTQVQGSFTVKQPPLTGWQLTPGTIVGGNGVTGNATVGNPVSPAGELVTFSASANTIVPKDGALITYGNESVLVGIGTKGVDNKVTESVGATAGGVSLQAPITILPASLVSITLVPNSVVGGINNSTGYINLDGDPGPSGCLVTLSSSNPGLASIPSTLLVYLDNQGGLHNSFTVTTAPTSTNVDVTITGTFNKITKTADLTVTPPQLASFIISPSSVLGGQASTGTVTLTSVTPNGGITVQLQAQGADIQMPSSILVTQGNSTASFTITSNGVPSTETETATATWDGVTLSATLKLTPPVIQSMSVGPTVTVGGSNVKLQGSITLSGPSNPLASLADVVTLTSSDITVATVTPSVTISNGASSGSFTVSTLPVLSARTVTITATFNGSSQTATLTVNPVLIAGVTVTPSMVGGGSPSLGQVAVTTTAGPAGYLVHLSSEKPEASMQPTVLIPAGATVASFVINTKAVTKQEDIRITGAYSSSSSTAILTLTPTTLGTLTISPTSLVGGNTATGTVQLNGAAMPPGLKVGLSSNSGDATVPGSVTIPAGATSATFAIKTKGVSTTVVATITAKLAKLDATAKLTIRPAPLESLTLSTGSVIGDSSTVVTGTVTLAGFGSNTIVNLSSSEPIAASVPATVKVANGKASASFKVTHYLVSSPQTVTITASAGGVTETATLVVNPLQVVSVTLTPASVVGGKTSSALVTLNAAVGAKPVSVKLSSSSSKATVPATLSIGGKKSNGKVTVKTVKVTAGTSATISASLGSSSASGTLTIQQ